MCIVFFAYVCILINIYLLHTLPWTISSGGFYNRIFTTLFGPPILGLKKNTGWVPLPSHGGTPNHASYFLVNQHNYGTSAFFLGKLTFHGQCSIAM